jgi:ketosteroid isomerase-like protein
MKTIAEVEAANAEFYAAFEALDLGRMSAVWADGSFATSVSCVHAGWPMLKGRGEVLRSWALIMANTPYIQFVLTDVAVHLDGERAVVTCGENILTADDESELGFLAAGTVVATNIFVRTPDGWKLWLHHGSPVLNQIGEEQE